jgi:hypothetical protein
MRMIPPKLPFAAFIACATLLASAAHAGGRNFGLGVVIPSPTGISAKLWTSGTTAFDFVFGWSGGWGRGYHDGYRDGRCYDDVFYRDHRGYCNDQAYDWRDYDDRYYRGRYYGWRTFHMHMDYLFHNFNAIRSRERFPLFYGPGINLEYYEYDELLIGVRGDFGIAWLPRRAPMDVFLEVAPVVNLFPAAFFNVNVGLGTRFYF